MHTFNETNNVTLFFQDVWIMVGDRDESLGERSKNQVCGYLPKDLTGSPIRALEWVRIICVGNTPLSGGFVTVQKSLHNHQRLFNCSVYNAKRFIWDKLYDYEDRLEFKELVVTYAEDEDLIGMSKENSFLYFYFRNRDSPQMLGSRVPHYRVYQIAQSCRYNQVQDLSSVSHLHNHLHNHQYYKCKYDINSDINLRLRLL